MLTSKKKLCYEDKNNLDPWQYREDIDHVNGGDVKVTRYVDGTSTVHWGGPCGDSHHDEDGEEC